MLFLRKPIEFLVALVIIFLLYLILLIAVDPAEQFARARNIQREIHIHVLSDAMQRYMINHQGKFIPGTDEVWRMMGTAIDGCNISCGLESTAESCLDLSDYLIGSYISAIPYDPKYGNSEKTHYAVKISSANRVVVQHCHFEKID